MINCFEFLLTFDSYKILAFNPSSFLIESARVTLVIERLCLGIIIERDSAYLFVAHRQILFESQSPIGHFKLFFLSDVLHISCFTLL